jgi:hypothetical protein
MKRTFAVIIILSLILPVRAGVVLAEEMQGPIRLAGIVSDFDPMEKKLLEGGGSSKFQEDMQKQIKADQAAPVAAAAPKDGEKKSNWWKWALGILIVGGIAAAAGGGGGGGGGDTPPASSSTGSATATW